MFITPIAVGLTVAVLPQRPNSVRFRIYLDQVGLSYDFFGSGRALMSLAFIDVWQWTPLVVLLLLAGLRIDSETTPSKPLGSMARIGSTFPPCDPCRCSHRFLSSRFCCAASTP